VGEELVYELVSTEDLLKKNEEADRRYETKAQWNVYPIRQNADGSWRLVVRTWVKLLSYDREKADSGKLGDWKQEPYVRLENSFLGYCDLKTDGSYEANPTLGQNYLFGLLPELLFTPLPSAISTPRTAQVSGTTYNLQVQSTGDGSARLVGSLVRTTSVNYEATHKLDIDFDTAAGRVKEIAETTKSDWAAHPSHSRTTYRLVEVAQHSPEWMAKFEAAATTYFQHRNAWWEHKSQASKARSKDACRKLASEARERIVQGQVNVELAEVRLAYDGLVALHDREVEWDIEAAAEREKLYAKPPVDWETTNLVGEARSRANYRGKVVILDFWYRSCGHCILALPKVKALHFKYKDRGVVVLGVNNDADLEDAHHVVNSFSIPYDSVRNVMTPTSNTRAEATDEKEISVPTERRISTEYGVSTWPTFVVLDQTGRVADVVSGNAEDLEEHVSQVVEKLLGAPPAK
jgi:thiol-disulfide isomerase/thioredoxin